VIGKAFASNAGLALKRGQPVGHTNDTAHRRSTTAIRSKQQQSGQHRTGHSRGATSTRQDSVRGTRGSDRASPAVRHCSHRSAHVERRCIQDQRNDSPRDSGAQTLQGDSDSARDRNQTARIHELRRIRHCKRADFGRRQAMSIGQRFTALTSLLRLETCRLEACRQSSSNSCAKEMMDTANKSERG
jgi:hypothetical protein